MANRRITIIEVADDVGILFDSSQAIFTNVLGMKRAAAKIVLKIAKFWAQTTLHGHGLGYVNFRKVIPGDESWVYCYDFEIKAQSSE